MKKIFLPIALLLFILLSGGVTAQIITVFKITYDASGNRIKREIKEVEYQEPDPVDGFTESSGDDFQIDQNSEAISEWSVSAYPNPVIGKLMINVPNYEDGQKGNLVIATADGAIFYETKNVGKQNIIDMQKATAGYYFLRMTVGDKTEEWVVVRQ